MNLQAVPLQAKALPIGAETVRDKPVRGIMESAVGRQYTIKEIEHWQEVPITDEELSRIRAFAVPTLLDRRFTIESDRQLPTALQQLLQETLPPFTWDATDVSLAPLHKYLLFHTSLPAPVDLATQQPMALEIYGTVVGVNDLQRGTPEWKPWMLEWRQYYRTMIRSNPEMISLPERLTLEIHAATYANLWYSSVNVPLYL
ncbi:MAG: hypothetical protein KDE19_16435 [Caldilineaceae bacterium]|nr:hypothetical protein [Caldilineaceae bacterium]